MIPKIICWIFGHKLREKSFAGYVPGSGKNNFFNRETLLYDWKYYNTCPRCGKKLKEEK